MSKLVTLTALLLTSFCASCANSDTQTTDSSTSSNTIPSTSTPSSTTSSNTITPAVSISSTSSFVTDDFFSSRDYRTTLDSDTPVTLTFSGNSITSDGSGVVIDGSTVTITQEGTYILTGALSDGKVVVNMEDDTHKAQLVLGNVSMHCSTEAPIQILAADKTFVTMTEGSVNQISAIISDGVDADAGIYSKDDITFNGLGTLELAVTNGDGIVGNDELTFTSGTYKITADGHGLDANDCIAIADGVFHINSGKDGLHCAHSSNEEKGYVFIADGEFILNVAQDGIDAGAYLEIWDGYFEITSCGGASAAPIKVASANTMGGMTTNRNPRSMSDTSDFSSNSTTLSPLSSTTTAELRAGGMTQGQTQGGMNGMQSGMQNGMMDAMPQDLESMKAMMIQMHPDMAEEIAKVETLEELEALMSTLMSSMEQGQMGNPMEQGQMGDPMQQGQMGDPMQQGQMGDPMQQGQMGDPNQMQGIDPSFTQGNYVIDGEEDANATSTKGLKAVGAVSLYGGTFILDCYDDAVHSDSLVEIHQGNYEISTGDDAIHSNWDTIITGGNIDIVTCFEGIEGQRITISGGIIDIYAGDDGINAASTSIDPNNSEIYLHISGGDITMDTNSEGDGVDSNGSILITGGNLLVSSTTDMRDTALDSNYDSIITGGTFIATGSYSQTIQNFDSASTQGSILVVLSAVESGQVTLKDSSGTVLVDFLPAKEYQSLHFSLPNLTVGETYTLTTGSNTQSITMDSLQHSVGASSNSMGGMMGGMTGGRR